jgi:hypothetical protein
MLSKNPPGDPVDLDQARRIIAALRRQLEASADESQILRERLAAAFRRTVGPSVPPPSKPRQALSAAGAPFITAALNPLPAAIRTATLTWRTADDGWAEVWVSVDGGPETLFVEGSSGYKLATWIEPGHRYDFRLYEGKAHDRLLGSVVVTRRRSSDS